jgi:precorrin-2/cobalt-factor-2 C20-methyltransferase
LEDLGLFSRALYIEHATMPHQIIRPIAEVESTEVPYWALILVPSQTQIQG